MSQNSNNTSFMESAIFVALFKKIEILKKLKIFNGHKFNNDNHPTEVIFDGFKNYIFCSSSIREKQKILFRFSTSIITIDGIPFFPFRLPDNEELQEKIITLLNKAEIKQADKLTISWERKLKARTTGKKKNIPKNWRDRIPLLEEALLTKIAYTTYKPKKELYFPLYITSDKKTAEGFLKYARPYNKPYTFYLRAIIYHVALTAGLFGQNSISTVVANVNRIKKLLPSNFPLKMLISKKNNLVKIEKINNKLIFEYDMDSMNCRYSHEEAGKTVRHQRIMIPFKILPHVFRAESFGRNGLAFWLLLVFGYRCRHTRVNYKPSTIVKLGHINTNRGINYTLEAINKPLRYMKNLGLLDFQELTKEAYKADIAMNIELYRFERMKKSN